MPRNASQSPSKRFSAHGVWVGVGWHQTDTDKGETT